jgi:ABC-type transport system involved in multi-copper enzyme maturation permease subunit
LLGPIFAREWLTVPRRSRHYMIRSAYLGALWVLGVTAWQATVGWNQTATLGDTARFGLLLFQIYAFVQLTLLLFFSALSAAGAVSQEKDRRTFVLLLMTDLRNYEIVLGKLFGSLLQILLLLAGTVPAFALLLLLGGVAPEQVAQAVLILTATAIAAGSLGGLIALWREKTFQVLALTVLFLILYLCVVRGVSILPAVIPSVDRSTVAAAQRWLDPFQALQSVLESETTRSGISAAYGFTFVMLAVTVLLNVWGIVRLRVWNPSGEPIMQRERPEDVEAEEKDRARAHAAPGALRQVWANPILWREVATRAYGRRVILVKAAYFIVLALICYYALAPLVAGERIDYAAARGLLPIGILSLLLVSAQAVTAITSERDTGALDLLLVTDLTPKEFIFGKLLGIIYNTKEYLLPPFILALIYACYGVLARPPRGFPQMATSMNIQAGVCVVIALFVLLAFAIVLGIHVALRTPISRLAILNTLGTIFFLSVGTLVCIYLILISGRFETQWLSFVVFILAGWGGLWWVLNGSRPSAALSLASALCPIGMFYSVLTIIIGKPGSEESGDPLLPFLVIAGAFSFTVAAMLIPLISEFDVALGRTTAGGE